MEHKGISMTLTLIVSALVILVAGLAVTGIGTGFLGDLTTILKSGQPSEKQQMRNDCLQRKANICSDTDQVLDMYMGDGTNGDQYSNAREWAKQVDIDAGNCWELAQSKGIFGSGGTDAIPKCERPKIIDTIEQCISKIDAFCSHPASSSSSLPDTKEWWTQKVGTTIEQGSEDDDPSDDATIPIKCGRFKVREFLTQKGYLQEQIPSGGTC
ncbi:MAG: hypothetical protein SVU32_07730 [Candidatus Nanohaloarchaea archaeon]|nr:hypothetical protein [Candidatus Nanohaloarchaea archaeon]